MRIVGVIAEYNPFHNGHAYHLRMAREQAGADAVLVVLSGCFTQRGDAAILSPRVRAEMALREGADAVVLLPACWAVRDAQHFALGGIGLLHQMGADAVSFGAEDCNQDRLWECARLLNREDEQFSQTLRHALQNGKPYPAALAETCEYLRPGSGEVLSKPNNTLAVGYMQALQKLDSPMTCVPIQRAGDYHATALSAMPSASAVRQALLQGNWKGVQGSMPTSTYDAICAEAAAGRIHRPDALSQALIAHMRQMDETAWRALPDLGEGIEDRVRRCALTCATRSRLLQMAKTRRYPHARLSRLCTHALLGMRQDVLENLTIPTGAWLLGIKDTGRSILKRASERNFHILTNQADWTVHRPWLEVEQRAFDLWSLGVQGEAGFLRTTGVAKK